MADGEEDTKQWQVPLTKRANVDGQQSSMKKIRPTGAAVYKSAFQACWQKKWPYVKPVNDDPHSFHCTVFFKAISCGHQGERDVTRHIASVQHQRSAKAMNTPTLSFTTGSSKDKTTRTEIKIANALVQNNIPLAFTDSDIARGYAAASTKTTCLVNGSLAPHFKSALVNTTKIQPFSIAFDGSNNTGLEKMNPMTVRLYDTTRGAL